MPTYLTNVVINILLVILLTPLYLWAVDKSFAVFLSQLTSHWFPIVWVPTGIALVSLFSPEPL